MLHGGGQNRYSWKNTGQILADDGFHVIALDSRGHGDSDRSPTADYRVETLCADTLQVLYQIGRPVVLIGASMGGLTGILAAHEAGPEMVTKLVLVDVVPRFEKNGSARIRDFMFSGVDGFETLEEAADAVAAYLPHRHEAPQPGGAEEEPAAARRPLVLALGSGVSDQARGRPVRPDGPARAAAINLQIPILLIRGKLSDVVSEEGVRDFLTKVPNAEFVELSDAGHTAAGDDNDAFCDVVVDFVCGETGCTVGFNFLEAARSCPRHR